MAPGSLSSALSSRNDTNIRKDTTMTTLTVPVLKVVYDNDETIFAGPSTAILTFDSPDETFSYQLDNNEPFPQVGIVDNLTQLILDGIDRRDFSLDVEGFLGTVTWPGGTTTALVASWVTVDGIDTDLIFLLDGDPLPEIDSPAEWNAFDDSITSAGPATGRFAPGVDILWAELDGATLTEDDEFSGRAGRDRFDGGVGDDYFESSAGNDTYLGGPGFDQVSFASDPAGVNVDLGAGKATDGYGDTDTLKGIEMLRGSAHDDVLAGAGGRNVLRGLNGEDDMDGGKGRDQVRYDRDANYGGTEGVNVNLKKGTATDGFGANDRLSKIEDVMGSDANDRITGSGGANDLQGLDGNDRISGLGGKDLLRGDDGNDILDGGAGDDGLYGGTGNDRFVFAGSFGSDTIFDFETAGKREKIDLSDVSGIRNFRDLKKNHLSNSDDGAVIDDGDGNFILLEDVFRADLSSNDFLF